MASRMTAADLDLVELDSIPRGFFLVLRHERNEWQERRRKRYELLRYTCL